MHTDKLQTNRRNLSPTSIVIDKLNKYAFFLADLILGIMQKRILHSKVTQRQVYPTYRLGDRQKCLIPPDRLEDLGTLTYETGRHVLYVL